MRHRQRTLRTDSARLARLATQLPGGSAQHPFSVPVASVILVKARVLRCLHCDGELEMGEDTAHQVGAEVLRRIVLACRLCHVHREAWFKIVPLLPS